MEIHRTQAPIMSRVTQVSAGRFGGVHFQMLSCLSLGRNQGESALSEGCGANFFDCRDDSNSAGSTGHVCMPGSINRVAEGMMLHMLAFIDVSKRREIWL
jgi:hypothetical protein